MTHLVARLGMNVLLCSAAISAIAAQSEQTSPPGAAPPPPAATHAPVQNRFRIVTPDPANELTQRNRERFADPEQRAALRAEQRAEMVSQNVGVARLVGLGPDMEQKLIDLLTDQQMEQLEQMHAQPRPMASDL